MKRVRIAELKDRLSEHLRAVEEGAIFEVADRNRPIALIIPIPDDDDAPALTPASVPFASIRRRRFPHVDLGVSSTELLVAERRQR